MGIAGVCGNGYCEFGEMSFSTSRKTCGTDCPGIFSCPVGDANAIVGDRSLPCVGKGACVPATGTCKCEPGYAGANCGVCAEGHTATSGVCAKPHRNTAARPSETLDAGAPDQQSSKPAVSAVVVGVIFGVAGLALICVAAYWIVALRRRSHEPQMDAVICGPEPDIPTARAQPLATAEVGNEPEIPTRQITESAV
jgi:hypothetical protein